MDFGTLLQTAKENGQFKKETRVYNTKFAPPKKEEKKAKSLSANIQKFLARKEAEEKQKTLEANRKKNELLALRSQDKKATRRVNVMLKRTKSANQSVIADAVDKDNTAVTLAGPYQPDEDDYGYTSQEASAFYNKMMEKYSKMPDEPKFSLAKKKASSNLSSTKDRVKAALEKEKEDALLPHRRKRKHKENEEELNIEECKREPEEAEPIKKKSKLPAPPPMNFEALLKLAEQKQHEPIVIEVKPKEEEGPLLTKKQKREIEKEQQRKDAKFQNKPTTHLDKSKKPQSNDKGSVSKPADDRLKKASSRSEISNSPKSLDKIPKVNSPTFVKPRQPLNNSLQNSKSSNNVVADKNGVSKVPNNERGRNFNEPKSKLPEKNRSSNDLTKKTDFQRPMEKKSLPQNQKTIPPRKELKPNGLSRDLLKQRPQHSAIKSNKEDIPERKFQSNSLAIKTAQQTPTNGYKTKPSLPPKQFPPPDLKAKQFPPKDFKSKQFPPPKDVRRKAPGNKRRILDDDSEYDSEMDDFIDDGPEESQDYSRYIKDIFGYDRNRYRDLDEDVDNMESTFAQQMKEDVRSTKLGIMEDLEDIKREKEEKRIKALKKKGKL